MLVEYYVDALIADEKAGDTVWALWDAGVIDDDQAALAWLLVVLEARDRIQSPESTTNVAGLRQGNR
jgi:hypothetical protein